GPDRSRPRPEPRGVAMIEEVGDASVIASWHRSIDAMPPSDWDSVAGSWFYHCADFLRTHEGGERYYPSVEMHHLSLRRRHRLLAVMPCCVASTRIGRVAPHIDLHQRLFGDGAGVAQED